jgi:hypothetical protein
MEIESSSPYPQVDVSLHNPNVILWLCRPVTGRCCDSFNIWLQHRYVNGLITGDTLRNCSGQIGVWRLIGSVRNADFGYCRITNHIVSRIFDPRSKEHERNWTYYCTAVEIVKFRGAWIDQIGVVTRLERGWRWNWGSNPVCHSIWANSEILQCL